MPVVNNWRDCKEWKDEGLSLSTASNEAAKLFDAALTQYVSWREIDYLGGLDNTLENLKNADPNFGFGHVLCNVLRFIGTSHPPSSDPSFRKDVDLTYDVCSKAVMNEWETLHLKALKHFDQGQMSKACLVYEEILHSYPTDILALKVAHDCYFYLGDQKMMKDSVEKVFGAWKETLPMFGFLFGMKAFALCENKDYAASETQAKKGLELNPNDAWSTHALAHNFEMTGRFEAGQKFLDGTVLDWEVCNMLSCHIHWHNALYSIEKGDYERAQSIYDDKIGKCALKTGVMLDLVDACSLLYRLQMEGQPVRERYEKLYDTCFSHRDDHVLTFNDLHFLMTYLGSGHRSEAEQFVQSLKELTGDTKDHSITNTRLGVPISEAMLAFDVGECEEAADWLKGVAGEVVKMGGSDAQREIFDQLFLNAAIYSKNVEHQEMAEILLKKKNDQKRCSPLTDRIMKKLIWRQKKEN